MNIEKELYKLSLKAFNEDEIPVACIIIKDNKIISKAYNKKNKSNSVIDHAEILAIKKAAKKLNTWNLSDCTLYCTLKPCKMCEEIIKQSYIKEVLYILENDKVINYKYISKQVYAYNREDFSKLLKDFFVNKR
ncbi:MAG: nucleoside deaminase [Bacilli bacterium]|nr:nucleoside deaminase [Bacilli bacterium]